MSCTQYFVAASLDGYIADAAGRLDWLFPFERAEGVAEHYNGFVAEVGALAMGASTYAFLLDQKLASWPYPGLKTWVFSHRELPRFPDAELEFTAEDVGAVHAQLLRTAGPKNVWLVGGGTLVAQFAQRGLLDEILLSVAPVVLGTGVPLLPTSIPGPLALMEVKRFGAGMLELRYRIPK